MTSLTMGSSIGTVPYFVATQLPNSGVVKAPDEDVGFGKRCLLDQEICDFMAETSFKQDSEGKKEENKYITPTLQSKLDEDWTKFIAKRDDDFCGFGFFETRGQKRNVNNLEKCYEFLIKQQKEKAKKK
ncbi:hypothetical protein [Mycoplasma ovis]|nr:hypothetical protein [Mycoplasma ovis]